MYSAVTYTAPGTTTDFAIPFPYIDQSHVEVSVDGIPSAVTFPNAGTARLPAAPASGATVIIRRDSNRSSRLVDFTNGANLTEDSLDRDSNQLMYLVQEAFDQASTQSYFSADAGGARVTNVQDPILDQDAATKHWVTNYVTSVAGSGANLLPLNNTWTGTNTYNNSVFFGTAKWELSALATQQLMLLQNAGLQIVNDQNFAAPSHGLWVVCKRTTGVAGVSDGMTAVLANSMQMGTGWVGLGYGGAFGSWKGPGATGISVGTLSNVTILNPDDRGSKVGHQIEFYNHEYTYAQGGYSPTNGVSPAGTGTNYYNSNSDAIWITGAGRTESNATYVGWNRGIRFMDVGLDQAKVNAYSATTNYVPGEYVTSGGYVWMCQNPVVGTTPVQGTSWTRLNAGDEIGAVGIDFASVSTATMGRMIAAIRLKGQMPIAWDSEGGVTTSYDPLTGLWSLRNQGSPVLDVNVGSAPLQKADLFLNGERRILGTRSSVSAHRNFAALVLGGNVWTPVPFPTVELNERNEYNASTGVFAPTAFGDYHVIFQVQTDGAAAAGKRLHASVLKNGVFYKAAGGATQAGINTVTCSAIVRMNGTTDTLSFQALWVDTAGVALVGEPGATFLQITKVS